MNDDDNEQDDETPEVPEVPCDCDACRAERGETEPRQPNDLMAELIAFNPSGKESKKTKSATQLAGCNEGRRAMLCEVLSSMPRSHLTDFITAINEKTPYAFLQRQKAFYFLMCDLAIESLVTTAERQKEQASFAEMMQDT